MMESCQKSAVTDAALPIHDPEHRIHVVKAFSGLPPDDTIRFQRTQWEFLAPVFTNDRSQYEFEPERILPFTEIGSVAGSGYFSTVRHVKIRAEHQSSIHYVRC